MRAKLKYAHSAFYFGWMHSGINCLQNRRYDVNHQQLLAQRDQKMLPNRRSIRFVTALAGCIIAFALACAHPTMAQQADHPMEAGGGDLEEIVVAPRPNDVVSVPLLTDALGMQSNLPTNVGQTLPEPKTGTNNLQGFVEGAIGNHGQRGIGGAVSVPLVEGKLLISVEGYETHAGAQ